MPTFWDGQQKKRQERMENIMELKKMLSLTRQTIEEYKLIELGDKIAVGLSGGKDSIALLYTLASLQKFYPIPFELEAITVDLGFEGMDFGEIHAFCRRLGIPYTVVSTQIGPIVFQARKETHPCSLCAKMRRGAINKKAQELGCNKIAYAHHRDDYAETLLMSLFFEGRFYTFAPYTFINGIDLSLIRPFLRVGEGSIRSFVNRYSLPVVTNLCPADHKTRREEIKQLMKTLKKNYPDLTDRLLHAAETSSIEDWLKMKTRISQ